MKKRKTGFFVALALLALALLLFYEMYRVNALSPRMDVRELALQSDVPANGPVMLTGGSYSRDADGNERYALSLHWDEVAYLYFPRAREITVIGSGQPLQEAYRGYILQLERTDENQGDYQILLSPGASLAEVERCVYFGSYEQINRFINFSVLTNYYVQGMCFAVMLLSAVLFLFKRTERYLIWLAILCFFRGSYYRLDSLLELFRWIPGVPVLTIPGVYLVLTELLAALLLYKIMESFMPVRLGKLAFPWYALFFALPILFVYRQPVAAAWVTMGFYLILYTCYLICFVRMKSDLTEKSILLLAWVLTVVLRFFDELCELGWIPSGDMNIKLRLRGLGSVVFVAAFFLVVGKRFAQKFQEADDLNTRLEEEIQQKARQQTVFVRSMLHNLKTPLFSLSGYSDMALDSIDRNPAHARKYMEKAREKAILAGEMMDRIFLVTQMDSDMVQLQLAPVNMEELLKAVAETPTAGEESKSLSLELALLPEVYVHGDSLYLRQAFQNLVDNARINTPDGGTVSIRMERTEDKLLIHVRDSGVGIAPEELDKIFEAYYSNRHGKRQSSGLGLYITREIIRRHGGSITVSSELGKGSDFQAYLPLPSVKM